MGKVITTICGVCGLMGGAHEPGCIVWASGRRITMNDPLKAAAEAIRVELEETRAESAALREIAEAVAAYAPGYEYTCAWCGGFGPAHIDHAPDCPVTKARALLGT